MTNRTISKIHTRSGSGFQSATYPLQIDGLTVPGYAALYALAFNFALSTLLSLIFNQVRSIKGTDETVPTDYRIGWGTRP